MVVERLHLEGDVVAADQVGAGRGDRVLLVDDDPQNSLTISLGIRNPDDDLESTPSMSISAVVIGHFANPVRLR